MDKSFKSMTYKEFKNYCNERACDGKWGMEEALACISIIKKIDAIKVKGFFKKKQTEKAREDAWKKIMSI